MRLMQPSPGECADRQTILALKMEACVRKELDDSKFREENTAIEAYLETVWFLQLTPDGLGRYRELVGQLFKVNARLWQLEDEIRLLNPTRNKNQEPRATYFAEVVAVAFNITDQNDVRANLVQEINQLFNLQEKEKMYA